MARRITQSGAARITQAGAYRVVQAPDDGPGPPAHQPDPARSSARLRDFDPEMPTARLT